MSFSRKSLTLSFRFPIMSKFLTVLLKILTFGIYGKGKTTKDVVRYRKDGTVKVDKTVVRDYDFEVEPHDQE